MFYQSSLKGLKKKDVFKDFLSIKFLIFPEISAGRSGFFWTWEHKNPMILIYDFSLAGKGCGANLKSKIINLQ